MRTFESECVCDRFSIPSLTRSNACDISRRNAPPLLPDREELLERFDLISDRGRWHDDRRFDAGIEPRFDSIAHLVLRSEQRRVGEPAVRQAIADLVRFAARECC